MTESICKVIRFMIVQAIALSGLHAAEAVELTGTYHVRVACGKDGHEERYYLVEPGPDKFSGKYQLLNLTCMSI